MDFHLTDRPIVKGVNCENKSYCISKTPRCRENCRERPALQITKHNHVLQGRTFVFDKELKKLLTTCYPLDVKDTEKGKQ